MGEKTEKATPKKLRDARKKGQVAKSQDFPSAFTFIASICLILGFINFWYQYIGGFLIHVFSLISHPNVEEVIPQLFAEATLVIFYTAIPILALVSLVGVIVNFLAVGPMFSTEVFKPDIKKFDMVKNLKAKFKMKTLVELIKQMLKISVAGYLIYGVMYRSIPVLTSAFGLPLLHSLLLLQAFMMEVVIKVGVFFLTVAILDFAYQKYNFAKEMKMEKFEIKQEYKNTEGDPQIKGKRKEIAREIAYSDGPSAAVQRSKAIVTNPTHLAIAIGYEKELDAAPYILAKEKGTQAALLVKLAEKYNKPVIRNIKLAHNLWEHADLYDYVPEDTFEALAEVLKWVANLQVDKKKTSYEEEDFDEDLEEEK